EPPQPDSLLVIDGLEQLRFLVRWRVKRHCRRHGCGLLVTAPRPMGFSPLFFTEVNHPAASELVAVLGPSIGAWVLEGFDIAARLRHHRGSLREVLFELYDRWEAGPQSTLTTCHATPVRARWPRRAP